MIRFTRLRSGQWGVRGEGTPPIPGEAVEVKKKDGGQSIATVRRILWSGTDDRSGAAVWLASIDRSGGGGGIRSYAARTGCSCGSREDGSNAFGRPNCRTCEFDLYDM